ncbi:hypothetical protein A5727_16845 [Mycobacterium sp. ACS4331]|nr:hypothetical protein [Mycobacterium sp. ACS4331]OBF13723.1 hypothetical protein A5727_16845 [Mycobacterium sp. ACS4331]
MLRWPTCRAYAQIIAAGVADGEFPDVHASFAADPAATTMVRIQQRTVRASTGLDDASAYRDSAGSSPPD